MVENRTEDGKPVASFRAGPVSCAVFQNRVEVEGRSVPFLKAKLTRRYRDALGNWQNTQSLSLADIPLAIHVLGKAFELMANRPMADAQVPEGPDGEQAQ